MLMFQLEKITDPLELLDFRALYTFVVALYKVPHLKGLALR